MSQKKSKKNPKEPKAEPSLKHLKLSDIVLLALAVVFLVIGIDQVITVGFASGYWSIMLALIFFFVYNLRRRKR